MVFLKGLPGVAEGEVKEVTGGYARNFLFPRGLAQLATPEVLRKLKRQREIEAQRQAREEKEARALAEKLEGLELMFQKRSGAGDRIHGSVSSSAIARELDRRGYKVGKGQIKLKEPLREVGTYEVDVELAHNIVARLRIVVERKEEQKEGSHGRSKSDSST